MRKFTTISKFILLVLFLMPNAIFAQNQTITVNGSQIQISSTLQTVLNQTETIYVKPIFKTSLNTLLNKTPVFVPTFIGLIMQRQELMMKEIITVESVDNLTALEEEIFTFLDQLAKAHNDTSPMNNSYMPGVRLKVLYQNAVKGEDNAICKKDYGIDPTSVEIEYLIDRSPNKNIVVDNTNDENIRVASQDNSVDQTIHYKLQVKDEDKNEINLFGEVAPKAELKDGRPSSAPSNEEDIPVDILVGTWISETKGPITFYKTNNGYVGSMRYETRAYRYGKMVNYIATQTFVLTSSEYSRGLFKIRTYKGIYAMKYEPKDPYHDNNKEENATIYVAFDGVNRYYTSSLLGGSLQGYDKQ